MLEKVEKQHFFHKTNKTKKYFRIPIRNENKVQVPKFIAGCQASQKKPGLTWLIERDQARQPTNNNNRKKVPELNGDKMYRSSLSLLMEEKQKKTPLSTNLSFI
ncbi:hypothetical protein DERP_011858 [Dermatophagoides pteronyssinus]|uniref:Uncharacterized protein n=1 Tax=Dermatophagoides pteronyssinus TaxID=6956 RepID=A0ABQ8JRS2_DERPT|nr:hypothetical protein DERP_011858 [Dermatophagoides pteronyssinus]